jgi:predicted transcriptional regulator/DNA-binding XRE family transcriptional regulator
MRKTFIGPQLRRLRLERSETQGQMARALGISASYVNLLENNERSVSVPVMLRLFEVYGVDWRDIAEEDSTRQLSDLRAVLQDPLLADARVDLAQLRAAIVHAPGVADALIRLHRAHQAQTDQLLALSETAEPQGIAPSPEAAVHDVFRRNRNHFREIEEAAERFWTDEGRPDPDETYGALKRRLLAHQGARVRLMRVDEMPGTLRRYDELRREIQLSEALDHSNRIFQLAHMAGLLERRQLLDAIVGRSGVGDPHGTARLRVELANYFAAALLMPYGAFLAEAQASRYDFDHLATRFGVSFEQACHRVTTLQREGALGVPFFFLRIDRSGNVTKRFNATDFHLAEYGGACPRLDVNLAFRTPGRIVPQFVEMPDRSQYFVLARTVGRPTWRHQNEDNSLAVAMGCAIEHVDQIGYARPFALSGAQMTPIGINCRVCPRTGCDQRAHQAVVATRPVDENRRGATRYEA